MNWHSHLPLLRVYLLYAGICVAFVYFMRWKHGMGDSRTFINLALICAAVLVLPTLLLHTYYILRSRSTSIEFGPDDQITIKRDQQQRTFYPHEIDSVTAYKAPPLTEKRMHWLGWESLCYWDLVIHGEKFRITSLTLKELDDMIVIVPERYRLKKRFMPIP